MDEAGSPKITRAAEMIRNSALSFFILGRVPELSLCEIESVLSAANPSASHVTRGIEAAIVSGDLSVPALVDRFGGVIKGGRVIEQALSNYDMASEVISTKLKSATKDISGRLTFGISAYSVSQKPLKGNEARRVSAWIQKTGIELKKELRDGGVSARFVAPRKGECSLSSVVVEKNNLSRYPCVEYVILIDGDSTTLGITEAVQDFEAYSRRDYHRPHRDMKTGLLPPKIARIMVNLAGVKKDSVLADPFCGLGTILQEALLLGHTRVIGGDIDEKNVRAAQENVAWLNAGPAEIKQCDARKLVSCFQEHSIDAIVTEPTLGRPLNAGQTISRKEIAILCDLYIDSFRSFRDVLKPGGFVVIVFPVWVENGKQTRVPCIEDIVQLGFENDKPSIVIAREDSRVARELFVFTLVP
ncbi:MAG: methyltransferase domain-containing protein, partial [Patescibacteria group bacterium]